MPETTLGESGMRQRATILRYAIASRQPWRTLNLEQVRRPGVPRTMTTNETVAFLSPALSEYSMVPYYGSGETVARKASRAGTGVPERVLENLGSGPNHSSNILR